MQTYEVFTVFSGGRFRKGVRVAIGFPGGGGGLRRVVGGRSRVGMRGKKGAGSQEDGGWGGDRQRNRQVNTHAFVKTNYSAKGASKGAIFTTPFLTWRLFILSRCKTLQMEDACEQSIAENACPMAIKWLFYLQICSIGFAKNEPAISTS